MLGSKAELYYPNICLTVYEFVFVTQSRTQVSSAFPKLFACKLGVLYPSGFVSEPWRAPCYPHCHALKSSMFLIGCRALMTGY